MRRSTVRRGEGEGWGVGENTAEIYILSPSERSADELEVRSGAGTPVAAEILRGETHPVSRSRQESV